jgi:hypothetical protein
MMFGKFVRYWPRREMKQRCGSYSKEIQTEVWKTELAKWRIILSSSNTISIPNFFDTIQLFFQVLWMDYGMDSIFEAIPVGGQYHWCSLMSWLSLSLLNRKKLFLHYRFRDSLSDFFSLCCRWILARLLPYMQRAESRYFIRESWKSSSLSGNATMCELFARPVRLVRSSWKSSNVSIVGGHRASASSSNIV